MGMGRAVRQAAGAVVVVVSSVAAACTGASPTRADHSPVPRPAPVSSPSNGTTGSSPTVPEPIVTRPTPSVVPPSLTVDPAVTRGDRRLLVVWIRGELPASVVASVAAVPGVAAVAPVGQGTLWLRGPNRALGPGARDGAEIPIDAAAADPVALKAVVPRGPWLGALVRGDAVLSSTSAAVRRAGPGDRLEFAGGAIRVGAVATDREVGAHEVFLSREAGARLGIGGADYLLVRVADDADPAATEAAVRRAVPTSPGHDVRVRSQAETPYLRQGDGVMAPEWTKVYFGEFSAVPGTGTVAVDPAWVHRNIVTARVPILGDVTCNRALVPPLRATLQTLVRAGLSSLVDPAHYGGCFAERLVRGSSSLISQHAYGAAIDVNVSTNLLGATPTQDPRVVRAFREHGFVWGGDFLLPDGMHFEYGCPAVLALPERTKVPEPLAGLPLCRGA